MTTTSRREQVRGLWRSFLAPEDAARHPLYAALCERAQVDDILVEPLLDIPEAQARPNLLLAALHDLALEEPEGELAVHYPSARHFALCGQSADHPAIAPAPASSPPAGSDEEVVRWLAENREIVGARMDGRSTQTNEVGRTAVLTAGLAAAVGDRPVALIDLGCSAGLNLRADHYRIERSDGITLGDPASTVVVTTRASGSAMPTGMPPIAWRAGVDPAPQNVDDDVAVRWLLACQWPDDLDRFERSRRAMGLWRAATDRPLLVAATAVEGLESLFATLPADLPVVVQHSWVAAYMDPTEQEALAGLLRATMAERDLSWLSFEHPRAVHGLGHPLVPGERIPGSSVLVLENRKDGARVLAQAHPHGTWIDWQG